MVYFISFIVLFIVFWNVTPFLILAGLKEIPKEHRRGAMRSLLSATGKGLMVLPVEMLSFLVVPIALLFTKREAEHLPKWAMWWDNNISINGDGWARMETGVWVTHRTTGVPGCIPYYDPAYTGDAYYAPGHSPRSYWARFVWLVLRNRASKFATIIGVPFTDEGEADRQVWRFTDTGRDPNRETGEAASRGWCLYRMGKHYQYYAVTDAFSDFCWRQNFGYKIWAAQGADTMAQVVNITISLIRQKRD